MLRLIQALIVGRPSTDSSVQVCGFLGGWWLINGCEPPLCCPMPHLVRLLTALPGWPPSLSSSCLPASVRPSTSRLAAPLLPPLLAGCWAGCCAGCL